MLVCQVKLVMAMLEVNFLLPRMCCHLFADRYDLLVLVFVALFGMSCWGSFLLSETITTKQVHASDVRPLPVLEDTLAHLLNLLTSAKQPFEVIHDFIFDRTRSIRQDLSMQLIVNDRAIHIYQEMVKFHVISHYRLRSCGSSQDASSLHYLNMEQLTKTLTSLFGLYEANQSSNSASKNEAEFRSFYVLLHLGSNSRPMGESLSLWFRHVPSLIMNSKEMCFSRELLRCFRISNYKRFLYAAAKASCLQYCIIEPYVNEVRALALSYINNGGYKLHPYPLVHLSKLLMMKESEVESFCNACGLETCIDEDGNKLLPMKQTTFSRPKEGSGTLGANADASRVGLQNASPIRVGLGSLGSNYDKVRAGIWGEIEAGFGKFCDLVENFGDLGRYTAESMFVVSMAPITHGFAIAKFGSPRFMSPIDVPRSGFFAMGRV
ncbi:hypothetical protein TIFTF001_024793 [Ficus carica]|uniref:SAC3/GANP/THP3 conserved domain-containing protein n=1 Tax=Ficus carica TaxID=3494 RepID=A0AA88DKF8_FICCA|nr:hypothetical protein TIFTF001_024793 [Ficus carica]